MRYLLLFVLLAFSFGQLTAQDAAPATTNEFTDHPARVVGNINALNMRSTPAIEANNIVGQLEPGQRVQVLNREGDWSQVRREDGLVAWSHNDYLNDLSPRQLGEIRLFRIRDVFQGKDVAAEAELRYIGDHIYVYAAENPARNQTVGQNKLEAYAETFDQQFYPEAMALWQLDPKPSHEGDERLIVLFKTGYFPPGSLSGGYQNRSYMPGEDHPEADRVGYIEIVWNAQWPEIFTHHIFANNMLKLLQHHLDANEKGWVKEGLSAFNSALVGNDEHVRALSNPFFEAPDIQLNTSYNAPSYGANFLFMTYLYEQMGPDFFREFAARPENGLAAIDAMLAERGGLLDTETIFADWVLANFIRNTRNGGDRYGYQSFNITRFPKPAVNRVINQFPVLFQETTRQYAADYFELDLPTSDEPQILEMELRFPDSAAQDGWLQLAQVINGELSVQRFRASESRGRAMRATVEPGGHSTFLTISPFRADDRSLTDSARFALRIRIEGSETTTRGTGYVASAPTTFIDRTLQTEGKTPQQLAFAVSQLIREFGDRRAVLQDQNDTETIDRYFERVEELLAAGADLSGSYGGSTLATVVRYIRFPELLAMLLDAGANPNKGGSYTFSPRGGGSYPGTPLNYAVFFEQEENVALLLNAGATLHPSVLRIAAAEGNILIIELLLDAITDPESKAKAASAAAATARNQGHMQAAELLEEVAGN